MGTGIFMWGGGWEFNVGGGGTGVAKVLFVSCYGNQVSASAVVSLQACDGSIFFHN